MKVKIERTPMTFDELCADLNVKPDERAKLAFYLAVLRAFRTFEKLGHAPG